MKTALPSLKPQIPCMLQSNVVYRINCPGCISNLKINTLQKIRTTQRAMERKILGISLLDKINHTAIRVHSDSGQIFKYYPIDRPT